MSADGPAQNERQVLIGRYQIVKRIGAGGMGAVYKARHLDLGREVALKVLPPDLASRPDMIQRFRLEATHAAKLRHEHIVTLYEFGECNGTHYLAMEFVEGRNLHEYIDAKGRLEPEEARKLILQGARALALAHKQGIVHRDIKPSNFLLTEKDGRPFVKLTDFGLARGLDDGDAKVTRTGTTVGTVDYISPEQARSSRAADIRSDIYSLGCTLYHMLTGRPPFPEGDLTERLLKHVEATPEDVRQFSPTVPEGLVLVLNRMMAKKPEERYQTPADLLKDLEHLPSPMSLKPWAMLEALAPEPRAKPKPVRRPAPETQKINALGQPTRTLNVPTQPPEVRELRYRGRRAPKGDPQRRKTHSFGPAFIVISGWKAWSVIGGGLAVVALIVCAIAFSWGAKPPASPEEPQGGEKKAASGDSEKFKKDLEKKRTEIGESAKPPDELQTLNELTSEHKAEPIYAPSADARQQLGDQFKDRGAPALRDKLTALRQGTGPQQTARPGAPVYVVSRSAPTGADRQFDSLAAACARAFEREAAGPVVVEIHDNGPLFEAPVVVQGHSLVLRAGKGFRPLLAWDVHAAAAPRTGHFLSVSEGDLLLEDLDLVLKCSEPGSVEPAGLVRLEAGNLLADGCTFSVSGRRASGVSVVQIEDSRGDGRRCSCRLNRCLVRGADVVALDVRAPSAEVVVDHCLFVGANQPLIDVRGFSATAEPASLRLLRSTLVANQTLVRVRPATNRDKQPAVDWLSWDSLLARPVVQPGGTLLDLQEGAEAGAMKWRAVNCLSTGWATLLKSDGRVIAAGDVAAWRDLWQQEASDAVKPFPWPAFVPADPSEATPGVFRVTGTPAAFRATSGAGALGCDVRGLPPGRDGWLTYTYEQAPQPAFYTSPVGQPPDIPDPGDGSYHGGRLNLGQDNIDLGQYLDAIQKKQRLGPKVVLRLEGGREVRTSPIRVRGTTLVLYFEPSRFDDRERLILVPRDAVDRKAFIEVEGGGFEMIGGMVRFPNTPNVPPPEYLLRVQGGDIRLTGCRLEGALHAPPVGHGGLIYFQGSGEASANQAYECILADSIFLSGKACIQAQGLGARVRLRNCVVVSGSEAFRLQPGTALAGRLNAQCTLENTTVAARHAVFQVGDVGTLAAAVEPLVIQARANVFLDSLAGPAHQAALLLYEGEALVHGLVVWQGDGNVYDNHFHAFAAADEVPLPAARQTHATFERLWGQRGDRQPQFVDVPTTRTVDPQNPQLERLALPEAFRLKVKGPLPGADLEQLGVAKKPGRKPK